MFIKDFNLYKAEWLDLVFNNRNKTYGAYELRSTYSNTMLKAMSVTVFGVVAAALTFSIVTKKPQVTVAPTHTTVVDLTKVMQPPPAKPVKHTPLPAAAQTHVNTVVIPTHVTSDPVKTEPPTLIEIDHAAVGAEINKGDAPGINIPIATGGTGSGSDATESKGNDNVLYTFADVSPEPNGGMAGWSKFLQSHLRYPDTEMQGRVLISFVVEKDGSLTDIKLLKGVDSQLDAEALRVIKIAPHWKPGLQGGKPVRVQYTIPINFQLNN